MREYPLDIRGLILRNILPGEEYRWVAPFLWNGALNIDEYVRDTKVLRRYQVLLEVDSSGMGRIIPRAAGIAARQGRITLAQNLLSAHILDVRPSPALEARALNLLNDEKRKIRRLLNRNREWPQDIWNLQDTPAWIIPAFIRRFRKLVNSRSVSIISGGHLLASGSWIWDYDAKSHKPSQVKTYSISDISMNFD
tara:strand:- start:10550 stop:11134 length:585 start_codon:yes stop_codon:yes gene_type:complete